MDSRPSSLQTKRRRPIDEEHTTMSLILYEVACFVESHDLDGQTTAGLWGYEKQFHPTHESADAACKRLRERAAKHGDPVRYEVHERRREDFSSDNIGDQEWRRACRQAGIDPKTGKPHSK
jgi:hypothetical protein